MRLTRSELAAAIRAARRYPPGFGFKWGCKGELMELDTYDENLPIPADTNGG